MHVLFLLMLLFCFVFCGGMCVCERERVFFIIYYYYLFLFAMRQAIQALPLRLLVVVDSNKKWGRGLRAYEPC